MKAATLQRNLALVFLGVAVVVLLLSFAMICLRTASPWPWHKIVHEDGVRTLLGTIFYFEHAARELPLDILMGIAIGSSVLIGFSPVEGSFKTRRPVAWAWMAVLVCGMILAGTILVNGRQTLVENLLQMKTRPDAALEWGSHWRYHLLSRPALILTSIGLAGGIRFLIHRSWGRGAQKGLRWAGGVVVVYGMLSLVFTNGPASLLDPFFHPLYLGHEARELFTHGLVTVPLGWGVCLLTLPRQPEPTPHRPRQNSGPIAGLLTAGALGFCMASYVGVQALATKSVAHGQTNDLAMLIFPHFFEHSFTYLVVPIFAVLVCRIASK